MAQTRMIIDTDCGVDDALAIVLALKYRSCNVEAITCCHGNTTLQNVVGNVFRVLKTLRRTEIPVYVGCERSLIGDQKDAKYHGADGFGNIADTIPVTECSPQQEHASVALARLARSSPGAITLLAIGPLTNLAIAQRLDPSFSKNLKDLIIMGGNVEGVGNSSIAAEFNFDCDPEAALVVLNEFVCPKLCIPWETCYHCKIPWDVFNELVSRKNECAQFIKRLTAHSSQLLQNQKREGYRSCDLFALACYLKPEVAETTGKYYATVELQGKRTRGQMVVERRQWVQDVKTNVDIVMKINEKILLEVCEIMFT